MAGADTSPVVIASQPGIKRDGTKLDGDNYTDGQWVRFQRGKPRKIGGYRRITPGLSQISRGMHVQSRNATNFLHSGHFGGLDRLTIDNLGNASVIGDRTPSGFAVDFANQWQFDAVYNPASAGANLFAHAAPNGDDIASSIERPVYYGDIYGTGQLAPIASLPLGVSGGVVALQPYLFAFGNDGSINWSDSADPTDFTGSGPNNDGGTARVTAQKIVRGMPLRGGGGNSPSGIFWSLDSVIRGAYAGGDVTFRFDTLTSQSSILSASSVIEYDGLFFWCGVDRFLMFNGVVREVPNQMNLNWFFDNLNYAHRQKVFAFKVPRFGEIWWCYPRGSAIECTHAVIHNVREGTWYDTQLPGGGRSAGQYAQVFKSPLVAGVDAYNSATYRLWQHEFGYDEVDDSAAAVRSFFETADMSLMVGKDQPKSQALHVECVEPDLVQAGVVEMSILGRANARSVEQASDPRTVAPVTESVDPTQQVVWFREVRRQMRFRVESNVLGGNYEMGQTIAHIGPADETTIA